MVANSDGVVPKATTHVMSGGVYCAVVDISHAVLMPVATNPWGSVPTEFGAIGVKVVVPPTETPEKVTLALPVESGVVTLVPVGVITVEAGRGVGVGVAPGQVVSSVTSSK